MGRWLFLSLFMTIAILSLANAGFVRSYLTVNIIIAEDGSANVREELRFWMNSAESVDLYKISLKTTNDLAGWRNRIGLQDIRYHTDTSEVRISNTRLLPESPDTCDYTKTTCYGTFVIEYKIDAPSDEKGIVNLTRYIRPRTIRYSLRPSALSFESSIIGESYLPEMTTLEIKIPQNSILISAKPKPAEYADYDFVPKDATKFTWHGRLSLTNLELVFEKKESLLSEVANFFADMQKQIINWITSKEGIALTVALIILITAYILLQRRQS